MATRVKKIETLTAESLSFEFGELAKAASGFAQHSLITAQDVRFIAEILAATNLNLSKLAKGVGL
jgi:hypothetical protein